MPIRQPRMPHMAPDANQAAGVRQPNIFSRSAGGKSVVTVVGAAPAPTGPWSYVTGVPNTELISLDRRPRIYRWRHGPLEPL